jgi:hypothetical protein
MIQKAQEIFIAKAKKLVSETLLSPSMRTPDAAREQLIQNLSKEMSFENSVVYKMANL